MEPLKLATDWARAEVFSSKFFLLFAAMFLIAAVGFWQLGKTDTARAYIWPTLVAGSLLLAVGAGIWYANHTRITSFAVAYQEAPGAFVQSEIERSEQSIGEYSLIVFKIIPVIIAVAALGLLLTSAPLWRAICITTMALMVCILLVDSNANARILDYRAALENVH